MSSLLTELTDKRKHALSKAEGLVSAAERAKREAAEMAQA